MRTFFPSPRSPRRHRANQGLPIDAEPSKRNRQPLAASRIRRRRSLWRLAILAIVIDLLIAAFIGGLRLRSWVWDYTASGTRPLRSGDIQNGYHWGLIVYNNAAGNQNVDWRGRRSPTNLPLFLKAYLNVYDEIEQTAADGRYGLDYGPGRLLVMALWTRHVRATYPLITTWQPQYAYSAPVLRFNTCCELIAAIGTFFLVQFWVRRGKIREGRLEDGERPPSTLHPPPSTLHPLSSATLLGLLAALLVWFNPGTLVDAHVWPQWDVWVMPFYIWALYLASSNRWFTAGAIFGVGIMFKGQILFAAPLLILWPLFAGRPISSLRFIVGFLAAVAIVTCGWLVNRTEAWIWIGTVVVAAIAQLPLRRLIPPWRAVGIVVACIVLWPWLPHKWLVALTSNWSWLRLERPNLITLWAVFGLIALTAAIAFSPRKLLAVHVAAVIAASTFSAGWMFHGSRGWFDLGFGYGTYKHLAMSNNSANLPAILAAPPYGWHLPDIVFTLNIPRLHLNWPVPMRSALGLSYFVAVILCSIGTAIKSRRDDPRILIAFVAPWLLLFALMPQMHQRYLMWAGVFSATMVGVSLGMTLMHLLLSALAAATIFNQLLSSDPNFAPTIHRTISGFFPSMGWLIALCAAVFLYGAMMGSRRLKMSG